MPRRRLRARGGGPVLELRLTRIGQMLDAMDPSPFREKALDARAESYLVGAAEDAPRGLPLRLVVHLPASETVEAADVQAAVRNHFASEAARARQRLREHFRLARWTLLLGLGFFGVCTAIRALVPLEAIGPAGTVIKDSLLVLGWVALWRPVELLVYGWWPLRARLKVMRRLAKLTVETRPLAEREA